jgi:uncharacterized surface protein with fasciclin (FAS1) repeats
MNTMTSIGKRFFLLLVALGGATVLAACNQPTATQTPEESGEEIVETTEPAPAEPVVDETAVPDETEMAETEPDATGEEVATTMESDATENIVAIASNQEQFSTLVAALDAAELAEVLSGEGPYTVFAPTDEAFAALPEGTVANLLKPENKDQLIQLLTYHVVPAKVTASEITEGTVETVEGDTVTLSVADGTVMVNDATVVQSDIMGSNGVIHAIDKVILPSEMQ